jgi:hypothetical protein
MAALAEALYARLKAYTAVQTALGGATSGSDYAIYPVQAPPVPPARYVVFNVISSEDAATHAFDEDTLDLSYVQFSCIAESYVLARNIRKAVRKALAAAAVDAETKAAGFVEQDGFSEAVDRFNVLLTAAIWNKPGVPA